MTLTYRDHCADWHNANFIHVKGSSGSLELQNVNFFEIRAQYKSLIYMENSSNLIMMNTRFEKIQTRPSVGSDWGVITINHDPNGEECP